MFPGPPVLELISNVTGDAGQKILVICDSLHGFPDLSFSWLKQSNILTADDHVKFPLPNELEIHLQGNEDQGKVYNNIKHLTLALEAVLQ